MYPLSVSVMGTATLPVIMPELNISRGQTVGYAVVGLRCHYRTHPK